MALNVLKPLLKTSNSPLHLAVLQDDLAAINLLKHNPELIKRKNALGFTAVELADLLVKKEIHLALEPRITPLIRVQKKGESKESFFSREEFEQFFQICYLQNLAFLDVVVLEEVIRKCPWLLRRTVVGEEHRSMGSALRQSLFSGKVADCSIRWIGEELGYGLFAENVIAKDSFIGQYTGLVRQVNRRKADFNGYCMRFPTKLFSWGYYVIDALHAGNELRFANHSDKPTMKPFCLVDRGLIHIGLFAARTIEPGEELTFNYGRDYWKYRHKIGG